MKHEINRLNPAPLVLAALAAFAWTVIALTFALLAPSDLVPRIFYSLHVEHFAAFYIVALVAAAGLPGVRLHRLTIGIVSFAVALEAVRMVAPTDRLASAEDLFCDVAGIWSALVPILVGRLRDAYARRRKAQADSGA